MQYIAYRGAKVQAWGGRNHLAPVLVTQVVFN